MMPIQHAIWKVGGKPEPLIVWRASAEKVMETAVAELSTSV